MPTVRFTANLQRHVACPDAAVAGETVHATLNAYLDQHHDPQRLRGYLLDEQGHVRTHIAIFVNGRPLRDRTALTDPLSESDTLDIMQALSGG
jgi:molybdopterin synthase sulfur carrier subunit